jgi:phospholipid/cholesterol/gamma-HCH transport system substrate-binding protein
MNLELPRRSIVIVAAFFAVSVALLVLMLVRLGTIPVPGSHTRTVRALVADAEGLPPQADVLVHGVKVGVVSGISVRQTGSTLVTLSLGSGAPPLHRDASLQIGFKTPLGEPFVDLDPGHARGSLGGMLRVTPTVAIDDALSFLGPAGRANLRTTLGALGTGAASPQTAPELSGTLAQLESATGSVGHLLSELRAQRSDLSGVIGDGEVALDTLASRAGELRGLTANAQRMLAAVGSERSALGGVLDRLPRLLRSAGATLAQARPLIARAGPIVSEVGDAAPQMTAALRQLPATTSAAEAILAKAGALRSAVIPALDALRPLTGPGLTALSELGPALADIVPVAQYLAPRGRTIAAWFANTADLGSHGDAKGDWARFFVMFDPATLTGTKAGAPPGNSYTAPGDAAHNAAYASGDYPRLMPYSPALGR